MSSELAVSSELAELFAKDPLITPWTEAEIDLAVAWLKQNRGNYDLIRKDGSIKRRRNMVKAKPKVDRAQMNFDEILKESIRGKPR